MPCTHDLTHHTPAPENTPQTDVDGTNCTYTEQSEDTLSHADFPLTATNVNMASARSAGVLARYRIDPGLGGLLLLLKKGKQGLGGKNHCGTLMGAGSLLAMLDSREKLQG